MNKYIANKKKLENGHAEKRQEKSWRKKTPHFEIFLKKQSKITLIFLGIGIMMCQQVVLMKKIRLKNQRKPPKKLLGCSLMENGFFLTYQGNIERTLGKPETSWTKTCPYPKFSKNETSGRPGG